MELEEEDLRLCYFVYPSPCLRMEGPLHCYSRQQLACRGFTLGICSYRLWNLDSWGKRGSKDHYDLFHHLSRESLWGA